LNDWENYRTQSEYENSLIVKLFLFNFVNSYTTLFYIAFVKSTTSIFGEIDGCRTIFRAGPGQISRGCLYEVTFQLVSILLVNMFVGQATEVLIPWVKGKVGIYMKDRKSEQKEANLPQWETEAHRSSFGGTLDEYSEMVIQFGYISLFAASFPLAPLLAVLNNIVEIRTDALKLVGNSRPDYRGAQDIGSWYTILDILSVVSVGTNCALIGFSINNIEVAFEANPSFLNDSKFWTLVSVVLLEHALLGAKIGLSVAIPDVPGNIQKAIAKQQFIKEQTLKNLETYEPKVWNKETPEEDEMDVVEGKEKKEEVEKLE